MYWVQENRKGPMTGEKKRPQLTKMGGKGNRTCDLKTQGGIPNIRV